MLAFYFTNWHFTLKINHPQSTSEMRSCFSTKAAVAELTWSLPQTRKPHWPGTLHKFVFLTPSGFIPVLQMIILSLPTQYVARKSQVIFLVCFLCFLCFLEQLECLIAPKHINHKHWVGVTHYEISQLLFTTPAPRKPTAIFRAFIEFPGVVPWVTHGQG